MASLKVTVIGLSIGMLVELFAGATDEIDGAVMSAKFAVMVISLVTLLTVRGFVVVITKPPVPVQLMNV
jgi:hypothetical protein